MIQNKNLIFWMIVAFAFLGLFWLLQEMLAPFLTGMLVAYLFSPLVTKLTKKQSLRWIPTSVVLMCFVLLIGCIIVFVVPYVLIQIYQYMSGLGDYLKQVQSDISQLGERFLSFVPPEKQKEVLQNATSHMGTVLTWLGQVMQGALSRLIATASSLSYLVITPVVSFYLLRDWPIFQKKVKSLFPRKEEKTITTLLRHMDEMISAFIRGQLMVALFLGVFYATSLGIIGLNFGILIGLISGALSIIPYVGTIVGVCAALIVAFFQYDSWGMIVGVGAVFLIGNLVEGNFLTPKLVGEKVNLHPVWVLFALLAGQNLLGFTGILIAVPTAAIIGVLVRFFLLEYKKSSVYGDG